MNKKLTFIIIVIVLVAGLLYWWWSSGWLSRRAPLNNTGDIERELNGLDVNNLDGEFKQIDQELNTL